MATAPHVREGTGEATFRRALEAAISALGAAGVPYLFMGGVASAVHGRTCRTHDIDVFLPPAFVEDAEKGLADAGFEVEHCHHVWLSKAWYEGVLVDLIHRSEGPIYVDDEMLDRGVEGHVWGLPVRVMSAEDLVVTKTLAHDEETPHYWWDALAIIAGCELDWEYLVRRARTGPRRVLSLLFYAQSNDLTVPDRALRRLLDSVVPSREERG